MMNLFQDDEYFTMHYMNVIVARIKIAVYNFVQRRHDI